METTTTYTWHDAQTSMMHVRFKDAWHGKVQQTTLQIKWSSIRNELHIDETPRHVIQFDLIYVLNNIKCWLTWQEGEAK